MVPPRGRIPRTLGMSSGITLPWSAPSQPSRRPTKSRAYSWTPLRTTLRITALRPGQSPPPVSTPTLMASSDQLVTRPGGSLPGDRNSFREHGSAPSSLPPFGPQWPLGERTIQRARASPRSVKANSTALSPADEPSTAGSSGLSGSGRPRSTGSRPPNAPRPRLPTTTSEAVRDSISRTVSGSPTVTSRVTSTCGTALRARSSASLSVPSTPAIGGFHGVRRPGGRCFDGHPKACTSRSPTPRSPAITCREPALRRPPCLPPFQAPSGRNTPHQRVAPCAVGHPAGWPPSQAPPDRALAER